MIEIYVCSEIVVVVFCGVISGAIMYGVMGPLFL